MLPLRLRRTAYESITVLFLGYQENDTTTGLGKNVFKGPQLNPTPDWDQILQDKKIRMD